MEIKVEIGNDPRKLFAGIEQEAGEAIRAGIEETVDGLTADIRDQVLRAGLGQRLANAVRGQVYPRKGVATLAPAGLVISRAEKVTLAFDQGSLIRGKDGLFLAVPTPAVANLRGFGRKRITPALFEQVTGQKLRFVYRPGRPSLLVVDNQRARTGKAAGRFAAASVSALRTGNGLATVVAFILLPQVKLPKKLDVDRAYRKWGDQVVPRIETHLYR